MTVSVQVLRLNGVTAVGEPDFFEPDVHGWRYRLNHALPPTVEANLTAKHLN